MNTNFHFGSWCKEKFQEIFSIDLRALAVFRICLALVLLLDLGQRATDITAHYTDDGIFPRAAIFEGITPINKLKGSPYYISGEKWWVVTLMSTNALLLVILLVGYRTRLMTCLCWLFLIALHDRNTVILHGGDVLLRVILLWAIFLPLGARYSIDSIVSRKQSSILPKSVLTLATVAYLLQIAMVYWSSVGFKWNPVWLGGDAVYYALNIDQFATPLGIWLRQFVSILPLFSWAVLFTELIGPILAFSPFFTVPLRIIVPFAFFIMHLCFTLTLKIEIFGPISMCTWIPFLPSAFWDKMTQYFQWLPRLYESLNKKTNFAAFLQSKISPKPLLIRFHFLEKFFVVSFLTCVITYNIIAVYPNLTKRFPESLIKLGSIAHIEQRWGMFSRPMKDDGWFVVPAKLLSGREVDLYSHGPLTWDKPPVVSETFKNTRWIKMMEFMWQQPKFAKFRSYYAEYQCKQWNSKHEGMEKLDVLQIFYMLNVTHAHSKGPPKRILLWTHYCKPTDENLRDER